jgi:hypothetical protein
MEALKLPGNPVFEGGFLQTLGGGWVCRKSVSLQMPEKVADPCLEKGQKGS